MTFLVLTVNNDKFGYLEDIIPYDVDEGTFLVLEEIGNIIKILLGCFREKCMAEYYLVKGNAKFLFLCNP